MAKNPYRIIKRPTPPAPNPGIDHDVPLGPSQSREQYREPIGPVKPQRSAGQIIREGVGNWLHRGAENFLDNMQRPIREERDDRDQDRRGKRGRGSRGDRGGSMINIPNDGPMFNPEILEMGGGGIDFTQHPDPMYHNIGRSRGGRRGGGHGGNCSGPQGSCRVTVTKKTYHYD